MNIPEDQFTAVPNEELKKIGKTAFVYKPSNYSPIAMDATIEPMTHVIQINLNEEKKDEAT